MILHTEDRIKSHAGAIEILEAITSYETLLEAYEKELLGFQLTSFIFIDSREELVGEILDVKEKIKKLETRYLVKKESF